MFCWFFKIMISNDLDNNKTSSLVEKHIAKCKSCCQFYNYAKYLEDKLLQDAPVTQAQVYTGTIDATKFKQSTMKIQSKTNTKWMLIPTIAACITIALVFSAILSLQKTNETKKLRQAKARQTLRYALSAHELITQKMENKNSKSQLANIMAKPYENEIDTIKNETRTTLRFLVSCIEVNIEDNQKKTTLN